MLLLSLCLASISKSCKLPEEVLILLLKVPHRLLDLAILLLVIPILFFDPGLPLKFLLLFLLPFELFIELLL